MSPASDKVKRVLDTLNHREPGRVPVGEFFWTSFLRRCKEELTAGGDFDPYRYWDLDMIVITPNMDPLITGIEVLEDTPERKLVRTGYGATIERKYTYPMPHFVSFDVQTFEQMEALTFDDPKDQRRYFEADGRRVHPPVGPLHARQRRSGHLRLHDSVGSRVRQLPASVGSL